MKSIIVYFSLTGNTKKVAYAIHKGMSSLVEQCDISTIKEVDIKHLADYDLIALGSPVWGGPPSNVRLFMNNLPLLEKKHAIAFCTHGAAPERFFPAVVSSLRAKGLIVIGIRDWYGSGNLPVSPKPYLTDGHPDEIDLQEAEHFGKEMVELSQRISAGQTRLIPQLEMPMLNPSGGPPRSRPTLNVQKCKYPECRLCMDKCPLDAIDLSISPPVFAKGMCRPCYFCEMICPEGAIEVDYVPLAELEIRQAKTVFAEALKKAESEGRFRRLVPLEKVGWNTPYYIVNNKHPRYIIPKE